MRKRYKIYHDVDGVYADFDLYLHEMGITNEERWSDEIWKPISRIPNFFDRLPLMADSLDLIDLLKEHDNEFLTALPKPTGLLHTADADKRKWLRRNVSETMVINTVVGGKNKVRWLKDNPGSVLIDDYDRNIKLWNEHGGIGILFTSVPATVDKLYKLGIIE